ncbi:MAG: cache domain-containing protein [Candidatus Cloacimonetes bacterium]|nr:cache domain-containing protein [Candidatus Cloacimonadota bacterium]
MKSNRANFNFLLLAILIVTLFYLVTCVPETSRPVVETPQDLMLFVDKAVSAIKIDGETVFSAFRQPDSEWFHDDLYIFVWGTDGMRYVYPPDPEGEGTNMIDLKDSDNRPIGKMILNAVKNDKNSGWVHYRWPKPDASEPSWKSTYMAAVKAPSGLDYVIGSGLYDIPGDEYYVQEAVLSTAEILRNKSTAYIDSMKSCRAQYIFYDSNIFIFTAAGDVLFNAVHPDKENSNIHDFSDAGEKAFLLEMINLLQDNEENWLNYTWQPSETNTAVTRRAYLIKLIQDNETIIIGAAYNL